MATISSLSSLSAKTGIGGLVSGMDIDELVQSLTSTSREKILKQQQNIQKQQWKQTGYRSVTNSLKEFQNKYLNVLSSTNFKSTSFFNTVKASSSSSAISVSSTSAASAGAITIDNITQLATNESIKSATVSKPLTGTLETTDMVALANSLLGKSMSITLDGKVKTITFDSSFVNSVTSTPTEAGFTNTFQTIIDNAFGTYKDVGSEEVKSIIKISINTGQLSLSAPGSQVKLYSVGSDVTTLDSLGFISGQSNKISTSQSLKDLPLITSLDNEDTFKLTINSIKFEFSKEDSLSAIINKINTSEAKVTISYSSINDKFTMIAKDSGAGEKIVIDDTRGNLMEAIGLVNPEVTDSGKNALLKVNGQNIVRSTNNIEIDGIKISLLKTASDPITVTMKEEAISLLEPIKKIVEDYNSMIELVNGLTKEKVYSDYVPLSDEQRDKMSESEVKNWEEKAKSGLLKGDSILRGIASKLQTIMAGISIGGTSLYTLGITSAGYQENGKLKIDEEKLTKALETKGSEIRELFTSEDGISNKINDIIEGAIRTSGVQGQRGTLVEMAGVLSTRSDVENNITKNIEKTNKAIISLQTRLSHEETRLWKRFTAMETALQQLNTQSSVLTQFSSGSQ